MSSKVCRWPSLREVTHTSKSLGRLTYTKEGNRPLKNKGKTSTRRDTDSADEYSTMHQSKSNQPTKVRTKKRRDETTIARQIHIYKASSFSTPRYINNLGKCIALDARFCWIPKNILSLDTLIAMKYRDPKISISLQIFSSKSPGTAGPMPMPTIGDASVLRHAITASKRVVLLPTTFLSPRPPRRPSHRRPGPC